MAAAPGRLRTTGLEDLVCHSFPGQGIFLLYVLSRYLCTAWDSGRTAVKDNPAVYTSERHGFLNREWKQTVTESPRRGP